MMEMHKNNDNKIYFEFDFIENDKEIKAPKFSDNNIALINTFLRYNSSYSNAENREKGSYSYILEEQTDDFFNCLGKQPQKYDSSMQDTSKREKTVRNKDYDALDYKKDTLYLVIEDIDRINSTHLASEGTKTDKEKANGTKKNKGRANTAEKLRKITNLRELLQKSDTELVHIIAGFGSKKKYNFSFATKFCAYVCRHALAMENYCIYDEVVQSILPFYIKAYVDDTEMYKKYYQIVNPKKEDKRYVKSTVYKLKDRENETGYKEYKNIIDEIIKGIEKKDGIVVNYEQFDHMLWYYFKGSKTKVQKAMNVLPDIKFD